MKVCQVCGEQTADSTLKDKNGHLWHICSVCVDYLWHGRQQMNLEARFKEGAIEWVLGRLRSILEEEEK